MKTLRGFLTRLLRGPRMSAVLGRLGIDSRRYWLLIDLFGELSDRGEMLDQLGANQVSLKVVTKFYFGFSVLLAFLLAAIERHVADYLPIFLFFSGFIILSVLLSETGNSLVNPVEGLILAHQPIDGTTYTAAKLSHLALILLYLVPGLNAAPALAGLTLKDSRWWYPLAHLGAALAIGVAVALACCAAFGWLLRFVPARRLRATAQVVAALPLLAMTWLGQLRKLIGRLNLGHWLPNSPAIRWSMAAILVLLAIAAVVVGLKSLSADFLIRVSGVMRSGKPARAGVRRSSFGSLSSRLFGGQPGRAGYQFVTRMMLRDWQFRRQLIPLLGPVAFFAITAGRGFRTDAFAAKFGPMHLAPHAFGFVLLFVCFLLPYGSDYKAIWFFLTVPSGSLHGFARGVWAPLWIYFILLPHIVLLVVLAAIWGVLHAALFVAYSLAVASLYLSLELRIVDSLPFMRQPDSKRGSTMLPIMVLFGVAAAVVSALQYFLIFRSQMTVLAVTAILAAAVWFLTRGSWNALESSTRFNLSLVSAESGTIYQEIDV